jgi:hypothetical protein
MRPIYEFLGLTVGVVVSNQEFSEKTKSYKATLYTQQIMNLALIILEITWLILFKREFSAH